MLFLGYIDCNKAVCHCKLLEKRRGYLDLVKLYYDESVVDKSMQRMISYWVVLG